MANGGCSVSLPSVGITPKRAKGMGLRRFSPEVVDSTLRIFHFDSDEKNPCYVKLDSSSLEKTVELIQSELTTLKGPEQRRLFHLSRNGDDGVPVWNLIF